MKQPETKSMLEMGARFIYTEPGEFTFNLIPSILAVILGIIVLIPLLGILPALVNKSISGYKTLYGVPDTGYGSPDSRYGSSDSGYGSSDTSYGTRSVRSFPEFEDVQEVVRNSPRMGETSQEIGVDMKKALVSQSLTERMGSGIKAIR